MEFYTFIAFVAIVIGFWNLLIAILGLFPQFLSTTAGTLTNKYTKRNVPARHGAVIPILTRYTYTYTVNKKKYRYSGEGFHSKSLLLPKVAMVYVKWFPSRAYPNRFKGTTEWVLGLVMLFLGVPIFILSLCA